jgi:serine/threonine protein kinase
VGCGSQVSIDTIPLRLYHLTAVEGRQFQPEPSWSGAGQRRPPFTFDSDAGLPVELDFNSLKPGAVLAQRYELLAFLGSGAYGAVYKALDRILETLCCVKLLSPEASENEESRERFRREILLARRIAHRNCCQIFDLGVSGDLYYIVMEYVDGRDVLSLLKEKQTISVRDTLSIAYQVCSALRAAHEANVIHRDLKPQNIMVTRSGIAKIMDFGIAKGGDLTQMTRVGMAVGTPSYMAPEQCRGLEADPRSDIYSLGIVLFYMLTGVQPFRAESIPALIYMHISEPPPRPSSVNPNIPPEVEALVLKCLEKDPDARYQTAVELRRAIGHIAQRLAAGPAVAARSMAAAKTPVRKVSASPPQEGSDGAQRFLEQVIQTMTNPVTSTSAPRSAPKPADVPSVEEETDEDEPHPDESLEEITAAVSESQIRRVDLRLQAGADPSKSRPKGPPPERVRLSKPVPAETIRAPAIAVREPTEESTAKLIPPARPQAPREAPPPPAAPSVTDTPQTARRIAPPQLRLGIASNEEAGEARAAPAKRLSLRSVLLGAASGGILLAVFTVVLLHLLGLLNTDTLRLAQRLLGLAAAGTP